MIRLVKLHLGYLLSRNNSIIISFVLFIFSLICLYESKFYFSPNQQLLYQNYYQTQYTHSVLIIIEIMLVIIGCYLFSNIKNNTYFILLKVKKSKFYVSKVITNIFVIWMITSLMFGIYLGVGAITKWFVFSFDIVLIYIRILLQTLVYSLITLNFSYLFKTNFAFIFVFFIYIIMKNATYDNIIIQLVNIFIPTLTTNNLSFIILIMNLILYILIGFCLFKRYENY